MSTHVKPYLSSTLTLAVLAKIVLNIIHGDK